MAFREETQYRSPAFTPGRQGRRILAIVLHHWGVDGQSHAGVRAFLTRLGAQTSAHFIVSDGLVTRIVDPADTAWHAGNWEANLTTIGIECRPEMTPGDMRTVAELIAKLRETYGPLPIYPHDKYFPTACPGRWKTQLATVSRMADEIRAGHPAASSTPSTPTPRKGQSEMLMIHMPVKPGSKEYVYGVFAPGMFLRFTGAEAANTFARQIGGSSWLANESFWGHCARAALLGTNIPENELKALGVDPSKIGLKVK
ncbi:N-acetylmuramoyl-L-alanine amidase [Schaalia sp. ZJ405]|uniref:peptidoglycan recognition protein family protein n=1 Tax=Schaalia sp. ZJ405 TaxID=2709403 RepID=UPI0013EBD398|nr:peptidoglycan recognition family protein [Schaalia sp. ZJ405]QPK81108.1 N-acetylmuramoyl-L-alanine amidase [Schaalia sp. ZJ405]